MVAALSLFLLLQAPIAQIDGLAQKRDVEGIKALATPELLKANPDAFRFLRVNGAYGTGRYGWTAHSLSTPSGEQLVVFSTPLTSEDPGEKVFKLSSGKMSAFVPELDNLGIKLLHHDFALSFQPSAKKVNVVDKVRFQKVGTPGLYFLIRFSPHYKVSSVRSGNGETVRFSQAGGVVALPTASQTTFTYEIAYSAVVDRPGYAGAITADEVMLTNDYWYPMIARGAATYTALVTPPPGWVAVAQGEPQPSPSGTQLFDMKLPTVYFSLTAGPYQSAEKQFGNLKVITWSKEMGAEDLALQNELAAPIVQFYSKAFGTYPFTQWGSMVTKLYGGGALEAYSFATYGTGWLPDEDAHEPAHTWWGGIIPNTYLKSFWNESFASYCEGLYKRNVSIGNKADRSLAFISDPGANQSHNAAPVASAGAEIGPVANSLGYGKGADVLQMLEVELGTDKMIETMREWVRSHPKGEVGEWEDYEKVVDRVAGKSYKWFFDQWLRRPGYADFAIENVAWANGKVTGDVAWRGEPYLLNPEVMLVSSAGQRSFLKGTIRDGRFSVDSSAKPSLVSVDPWRRILRPVSRDENPLAISRAMRSMRRYTDPQRKDWLEGVGRTGLDSLPEDLNNVFMVASPETTPRMRELCRTAGFAVSGDKLTYKDTTIDLNQGAALALVPVEGGTCLIGLGKTLLDPQTGRAQVAVVDKYGRFLRGSTEPKTSGFLTFKL